MAIASQTATVTNTLGGSATLPFVWDGLADVCLPFGSPIPTTYRVQSIAPSATFFNISENFKNAACQTELNQPQFSVGPNGFVTRTNAGHAALGLTSNDHPAGATRRIQVEWDIPNPPPGPCEHGFRIIPGQPAATIINDALLNAAGLLHSNPWVNLALQVFIGQVTDNNILCAGPPPTVQQIATSLLINPGKAALEVLYAQIWDSICECVPGTPTPTPPAPPSWTQPPDWPAAPTYPVNPTNPCLDLTEVRRKLDEVLRLIGNDVELDRAMQRFLAPFAWVTGTRHTDLSGTGSFGISRCLGFLVEVTTPPPSLVLPGNPTYWWDMGWMSVTDGGALLIERRVNRSSIAWFPPQGQLADHFGWYLTPGVAMTVTELLPEP